MSTPPPPRPSSIDQPPVVERPSTSSGTTRRSRRTLWIAAAVIGVLAVGAGGIAVGAMLGRGEPTASNSSASPSQPATSASALEPPDDAARTALTDLDALTVVSGRSDAAYDRDLFGQRWADVDRNGCDTRNDILGRDLLNPVFKAGTRDCKVLTGVLIDPYDGMRVDFVSGQNTSVLVQIDHVVALAWAWRHGAEHWTDEQRTAFANDPRNLVASSEAMNQQKSASGPSDWMPPVLELRCGYLEQWVAVLTAYDLGVNVDDRDAAATVLRTC